MSRIVFWLLRWLIVGLVISVCPKFIPGIEVDNYQSALAFALVLGLLNAILRPILVILTFPITLITFGFFLLVINATVFYFAGSIVSGITIASFGSAFLASLAVSLVSCFINWSTKPEPKLIYDRRAFRDVN